MSMDDPVRPRFEELNRLVHHLRRSVPMSVERAAESAGIDPLEWERLEGRHGRYVADPATYQAVARVLMPEDHESLAALLCELAGHHTPDVLVPPSRPPLASSWRPPV